MYQKSLTLKFFSLIASLALALEPSFGLLLANRLVFAQEGEITEEQSQTQVIEEVTPPETEEAGTEKVSEDSQEPQVEVPEVSPSPQPEEQTPPEKLITPTPVPTPTATPIPTPTPTPTISLLPSLTASPTPEEPATETQTIAETEITPTEAKEAPTEEPAAITKVCLEPNIKLTQTINSDWQINEEEGWAKTNEPVKLGVIYVYPQEEKVTVTFTCLPEDETLRAPLKIQKVKMSDLNLPEGTNPYGEYAYDITTGMADGTFEYDLTLPKPEDTTAEVSYIEKTAEELKNQTEPLKEDEIKPVEEEKIDQERDKVIVENIDHFTVFVVVYNTFPVVMPGSYPSLGFQATSTFEFGDHLILAETERNVQRISIGLTSWACGNDFNYNSSTDSWTPGRANNEACTTTPGSYFQHPLTLNVYSVNKSSSVPRVGALILSKTINANIPFRPSYAYDQRCTAPDNDIPFGGTWYDPVTQSCVHGFNFKVTFDLDGQLLPDEIIVALAFNTQSYGTNPLGVSGPYNSLNMSVGAVTPTTGTNVNPDDVFWNTSYGSFYADSGVSGVNLLRQDTGWSNYVPLISIETNNNICPVGNVKYEVDDADYEYSDGSATIEIAPGVDEGKNSASWLATSGYEITEVCIKIGGPGGGSLKNGLIDGGGPFEYDISHVVITTKALSGPYCGDSIKNGDEECDYGVLNGDSICSANCSLIRECLPEMAANGDFEIPKVTNSLKWDIFSSAEVPGWIAEWYGGDGTRPEPQIELHSGVNSWTTSDDQYVELDSDWDGPGGGLNGEAASISIYQNIPVLAGYEYKVSWSYSPRPNHNNNGLRVEVDGDEVFNSGIIAGEENTVWTDKFYTFVPDLDDVIKISFTETGTPDSYGMFLDNVNIECLGEQVPECIEEGPVWADKVGPVTAGTLYNGNEITDPIRIDPEKALGEADGNFYSLGKNGEIILNFYYYIANVPGNDLSIHEITWNRLSDIEETAEVWVKNDHTDWILLGEASSFSDWNGDGTRDGINYFDLSDIGLPWINSVKLVESSTGQAGNDDGFDIDAVDATQRVCEEPVVRCGDGIVNQDSEECDGKAGITPDQNFCTVNCKLVPIYDGDHNCPQGTVRSQNPVWSGTISATDANGETFDLAASGKYLFEASGDYIYGQNRLADTAYAVSGTDWSSTIRNDVGVWGTNRGVTSIIGDLGLGVGVIEWDDDQSFDTDHTYQKYFSPTNNITARFLISDWYGDWFSSSNNQGSMGDNSRGLELKVYECQTPGRLQGTKYLDENANGVHDYNPSQTPYEDELLNGWTIRLYDENWSFVDETATADLENKGQYRFDIAPGTYNICEKMKDGFTQTGPVLGALSINNNHQPTGNGTAVENNSSNKGEEGAICWQANLQGGETDGWLKFGNIEYTSISGNKFNDENSNGTQDGSELGLEGWTIYAAQEIESLTVDALNTPAVSSGVLTNGEKYLIRVAGTYDANDGITADAKYSQRNPNTVWTDIVQNYEGYGPTLLDLQINGTSPNWGSYNPSHAYWLPYTGAGSSASFEIYDLGNGSNNSGSLDVKIYKVLDETTTGADGSYSLNIKGVLTGDIIVAEQTQTGWAQTAPYGTDFGYCTVTAYSQNTCNFGNRLAPDKGTIIIDKVTNPSEDPQSFTINIKQGDKVVDNTSITDSDQPYEAGLVSGIYSISEEVPTGWVQDSVSCRRGNDNISPDNIVLAPEEVVFCTFTNTKKGSISGYKYEDINGNGQRDENENNLLSDWTIELRDENQEEPLAGTVTENGNYQFSNITPGNYNVCEINQAGWYVTDPHEGPVSGTVCKPVSVSAGQDTQANFGNFKLGKISGYKIYDRNDNGVQDTGEEGIEGWEICLTGDSLEAENCTFTNENGYYEFTGLAAGIYTITEEDKSADGWRASNPEDMAHEDIEISSGSNAKADFYNAPPAGLTLSKTNNTTGAIKPGDNVEYTLTIGVGERTLSYMKLIDILPFGFTYQAGTSTINDSPAEPAISRSGKRLVWEWPTGAKGGSTITVKYTVTVGSTNRPAAYTNHAFVFGHGSPTEVSSEIVFSNVSINPEYNVEGKTAGGEVLGAATTAGSTEGAVLGATTLPATGANTWYSIVALILIGAGITLRIKTKKFEDN